MCLNTKEEARLASFLAGPVFATLSGKRFEAIGAYPVNVHVVGQGGIGGKDRLPMLQVQGGPTESEHDNAVEISAFRVNKKYRDRLKNSPLVA